MLYRVINKYNNGIIEDFIDYSEKSYGINPKNIKTSVVSIFKYEVESSIKPSIINVEGKNYIVPNWIPCHPKTELKDIIWVKKSFKEEEVKEKTETQVWKFKSSSGDNEYTTRKKGDKYTCNCSGFFRVKDREKGCKHIQQVKSYTN